MLLAPSCRLSIWCSRMGTTLTHLPQCPRFGKCFKHMCLTNTDQPWPAGKLALLAGGEKGSDGSQRTASDDDQEEDEGAADAKELAAETQRVLRGAALPLGGMLCINECFPGPPGQCLDREDASNKEVPHSSSLGSISALSHVCWGCQQ